MSFEKPITHKRKVRSSALYQIIDDAYEDTVVHSDKYYPRHVLREFEAFLRCGVAHYGFMQTLCSGCKDRTIVAFSCKKRGFCTSCAAKRSFEKTDHIVENLFPEARVRQWVLSVPFELRYFMAKNTEALNDIHRIIYKSLQKYYRRQHQKTYRAISQVDFGGISFIQRYSSKLSLNIHFHILVPEIGYDPKSTDGVGEWVDPVKPEQVLEVLEAIVSSVVDYLRRRNFFSNASEFNQLLDESWDRTLEDSILNRLGKKLGRGFGSEGELARRRSNLCFEKYGFSLHAGVCVWDQRPKELRKLIGYVTRPVVSESRLKYDGSKVTLLLKRPYSDGTRSISYTPEQFIKSLASIVPPMWENQVRYWGVFAPNHRLRKFIVEKNAQSPSPCFYRRRWAEVLKATFGVDRTKCEKCEGRVKVISVIRDYEIVRKILKSMSSSGVPP